MLSCPGTISTGATVSGLPAALLHRFTAVTSRHDGSASEDPIVESAQRSMGLPLAQLLQAGLSYALRCRGTHKDRIEIKRTGGSNVKANITLEQEFQPPAFKLSEGLAQVGMVVKSSMPGASCSPWCKFPDSSPSNMFLS